MCIQIQSIMRRSRRIGLAGRYYNDPATTRLIRCFMALPLLTAEHIRQKCEDLCIDIRYDDTMLNQLREYMLRQWIMTNSHPLSSISAYCMSIRMNNDTEASHRSLNKCVGECHINIYKLMGFFIRLQNSHVLLVLLLNYRKSIDNKRQNSNRTTTVSCLR